MTTTTNAIVPQRNGLLTACHTTLREVAGVLGRVNKAVLRDTADVVSFSDIFNCMAQLKHVTGETVNRPGYIRKEGLVEFSTESSNNIGLSEFMRRAASGTVDGLKVDRCESESLMVLASTLRLSHANSRTSTQ